jgi:predicted DNA-binding transcriptional regulator YafY
MRASRLLSLLLLLQTRGRLTARELADELEVSLRTVYRDVESLSEAGVPIYADRGPSGGYQLLDGYRTRLTGLTTEEAEALFLAGMPGPAAELGLGEVLAATELKLLAALPPELRSRAGRVRERIHLDAPGWFHEADRTPHLAAVADAVWHQRALRVRYRRWGGEVWRELEPLGLVLKAGAWYLVAQVEGQPRAYRVARILDLATLERRFERPAGFDLAAFWAIWSEDFHSRIYPEDAIVRLSPRGLALLPYVVDPGKARVALACAEPPDQEGWVRVKLPTETLQHALVDVLKFGADAEALAPPELRRRLAETARVLSERYEGSGVRGQESE